MVLCLLALPLGAVAEVLKGDVNGDGKVDITDVTLLINSALSEDVTGINVENADMNGDGKINVTDVTLLIDVVRNQAEDPHEGDWVDLGLPSGTLWATCNVGANAPEEYGDYFAWGETEPKSVYSWSTYKWCNGTYNELTKYCTYSEYGDYGYDYFVDFKTELDPEDDAAYVNWGPSWRMPTEEQVIEMSSNCTKQWTQRNGVNGLLLIGSNGNTMFLPAVGYRQDESLNRVGVLGYYWSRTLNDVVPYCATDYSINTEQGSAGFSAHGARRNGSTVRAVRVSQN